MTEKCLLCSNPASDIRSTQFAGNHPYCREHAQLEPDWGENDSYTVWTKVKPTCPWDNWRPSKDIV
jgi:hypothetical protein